jgi:FkbM family methyltransferase
MYLSPSDYAVGREILNSKTYEPNVTRILNEKLRPGMTVLDVGANIGYFSLLMSVLVGREGRCIAIEPNPRNVKLLLASKNLNRFEQLEILQAAAGNTWGILQLNTSHSNGVVSPVSATSIEEIWQRETVLSLRIDGILPPDVRVDLIRIDVEGSEFNALSGALRCIENDRPFIISEFMPEGLRGISGVTPEEYLGFLTNRGYQLSVLESDHCVRCHQDAVMVMKRFREKNADHIDILDEPLD